MADPAGRVLHLASPGSRASLRRGQIQVRTGDDPVTTVPLHQVAGLVVHGNADVSSLRSCFVSASSSRLARESVRIMSGNDGVFTTGTDSFDEESLAAVVLAHGWEWDGVDVDAQPGANLAVYANPAPPPVGF